MRTLAFDGQAGASGDMILGALIAAGADPAVLDTVETALPITYRIDETTEGGLAATDVAVELDGGSPAEGHGPHRHYAEVVGIVEGLDLPASVEGTALSVFELLGAAEAAVHGTDIESIHFHEVGADDAIADVVGAALLLADLDVDRVVTTPPRAGGGSVETSHGTYPVPTPAVVEIAERASWTLAGGPVDRELLTPTGAAVLAVVAEGVESLPPMGVAASGYGVGGYDLGGRPNVLRATVGTESGGLRREAIRVLETNVDDVDPEALGGLQERLAAAGARDVTVLPAMMKKSRPGNLVKVVVDPGDAEAVARALAGETGTLGVREHGAGHRWVADRRVVWATIEEDRRHEVGVKIGSDATGEVFDVSAEYDDAAAVARETGLTVRSVRRRAETAVREGGALDGRVYHVIEREQWEAVEEAYAPASLEGVGYVHCSPADRLVAVAQYNHPDAVDPVVLAIDPDELDAAVVYEETPSGAFPHVYGSIGVDAVADVFAFPREDGRYQLPEALS